MPDSRSRGKKRDAVFAAADFRCEYCQTPIEFTIQPFVVEHIIPVIQGGKNSIDNLACACGGCNGGRATVAALHLNRAGLVNIRRLMVLGGVHPPER